VRVQAIDVSAQSRGRGRGRGPPSGVGRGDPAQLRRVGDSADGVAQIVQRFDRRDGGRRGRRDQDKPVRLGDAVVGEAGPVGRGAEPGEAEEARGRSGRKGGGS